MSEIGDIGKNPFPSLPPLSFFEIVLGPLFLIDLRFVMICMSVARHLEIWESGASTQNELSLTCFFWVFFEAIDFPIVLSAFVG